MNASVCILELVYPWAVMRASPMKIRACDIFLIAYTHTTQVWVSIPSDLAACLHPSALHLELWSNRALLASCASLMLPSSSPLLPVSVAEELRGLPWGQEVSDACVCVMCVCVCTDVNVQM